MYNRRFPIFLFILVLLTSGIGALFINAVGGSGNAGDLPSKVKFYNYSNGLGVEGYDLVSYFEEQKAIQGKATFTAKFGGKNWQFSSVKNMDKFTKNPAKYLPQYGGHCAYGVAQGYLVRGDPTAWSIRKGKLYLNYSKGIRSAWLSDAAGFIRRSENHWPQLNI